LVTVKEERTYASERGIMSVSTGQLLPVMLGGHKANIECGRRTNRRQRISIGLIGDTGVGKTYTTWRLANTIANAYQRPCHMIALDLAAHKPEDLVGLPVPVLDGETGQVRHVVFATIQQLVMENEDDHYIIFLDEGNRADTDMRQALYRFVGEGAIDDRRFPLNCTVILAMNPPRGQYTVNEFDIALLGRMIELQVEVGATEWLTWAQENDIHEVVIEYIRKNPDNLMDLRKPEWVRGGTLLKPATPRGWEYVSHLLHALDRTTTIDVQIRNIAGVVGETHALEIRKAFAHQNVQFDPYDIVHRYDEVREKVQMVAKVRQDMLFNLESGIAVQLESVDVTSIDEVRKVVRNIGRFMLDIEPDWAYKQSGKIMHWVHTNLNATVRVAILEELNQDPEVSQLIDRIEALQQGEGAVELGTAE
jgi:GTPase SAR1 family protein